MHGEKSTMKFRRILSVFLLSVLMTLLLIPGAAALEPVEVNAKAALLVDVETGTILYGKNETKKMYPASITKVMTTLLVLEAVERGELQMDQLITASEEAFFDMEWDGSNAGIEAGEEMRLKDLLYCIMVVSANEACNIVAEAVDGSISAFVERMNARAAELGCHSTHFTNPHGLHDVDHYTTAWDIYLMAREAIQNETFMTLCNTLSYEVPPTNMSEARELHTTNSLISNWKILGYLYDGAEGIKTGTTDEAGYCLLSSAVRSGQRLICVVLGCDGSGVDIQCYPDSSTLYDYGFDNFSTKEILNTNELIAEVPVELSKETNYVVIHPATDADALLPNELDPAALDRTVTLNNDVVYAPIVKGDVLGEITLSYDGQVYATVPLLAQFDVNASQFLTTKYQIKLFLSQRTVQLALVAAAVVIAIIVIWWKFFRPKRRYGSHGSKHRSRRTYRGRRRR